MNTNSQKINWFLDFLMFAGFLAAFFLDFTGVEIHQWLGVLLGVLTIVHFMCHADWLKAVLSRFFGKNTTRNRLYVMLDFLIMLGFVMMLETGIVISTWLNIDLSNYGAWRDLHVHLSIATLVLVTIKIGFHWRWVVNIAQKICKPQNLARHPQPLQPVKAAVHVPAKTVSRRDFILTMGAVGLGSALAIKHVLTKEVIAQAAAAQLETEMVVAEETETNVTATQAITAEPTVEAKSLSTATTVPTATSIPTTQVMVSNSSSAAGTCSIRCNKRCSYPGHCRKYTDSNNNGKCDLGECS